MMNNITAEARELFNYAYRDGTAYARFYIPMERRQTEQTVKLGRYDQAAARINWRNVARRAAALYCLVYCGKGENWRSIFDRHDIRQAGDLLCAQFESNHYMMTRGF